MTRTDETDPRISGPLARNWGWLVGLGALLLVLGTLAILAPVLSSIAINAWIGAAFLVAGLAQGAHALSARGWSGGLAHLAIGAVYVVGGLLVLFNPMAGMMAFSIVVAVMLLISGAWRLWDGLQRRPEPGWGWQAGAGGAMVAAAAAIWLAFPGAAFWLLGLLAGFAFIAEGWALLLLGLAARRATR